MTTAPERPLLVHRVIARLNVGGPAIHVVELTAAMNEGRWRTRLIAGSARGEREVPATGFWSAVPP